MCVCCVCVYELLLYMAIAGRAGYAADDIAGRIAVALYNEVVCEVCVSTSMWEIALAARACVNVLCAPATPPPPLAYKLKIAALLFAALLPYIAGCVCANGLMGCVGCAGCVKPNTC